MSLAALDLLVRLLAEDEVEQFSTDYHLILMPRTITEETINLNVMNM